ncbi:50S ribosomal protein L29 [Blattabacterium cuenoti]|uniref:50S ribosomal protein L29 n=1 Tax=Blattabacterium cuenoti TaxID=1653831 RepID=UPI00163C9A09|nr:50S ribosomal protein L29 [Blattabacterium cuenoti]
MKNFKISSFKRLNKLSINDLENFIKKNKKKYQQIKFAHSVKKIKITTKISNIRKYIAQLKTELNKRIKSNEVEKN